MKPQRLALFTLILTLLSPVMNAQAGIQLGSNRLIYDAAKPEAILKLKNSEDRKYLVQTWVDAKGNPQLEGTKLPILVNPPLFRMSGNAENIVQLIYSGKGFPTDRETLFWLNVKSIPSLSEEDSATKNRLLIALSTRIKVFYRPAGLSGGSAAAITDLSWQKVNESTIKAVNKTPYYVVLNKVKVNNFTFAVSVETNNSVIPPFSEKSFAIDSSCKASCQVTWSAIKDFNATSQDYQAAIK